MKFVVITKDSEVADAAREGFHPSDECKVYEDWRCALEDCDGADLLFVDLLATLRNPNEIAGYEEFAMAKMNHETADKVKLILVSPPEDYVLDFMSGWPDFVYGHVRRPVSYKIFRRASTWI